MPLIYLLERELPQATQSISTRVSATAQALTKDLELLKIKLRQLLQYLNTSRFELYWSVFRANRRWQEKHLEIWAANRGRLYLALVWNHCSPQMWTWQRVADGLRLHLCNLAPKFFGINVSELWPLPAWPEFLEALLRS